MIMPTLIRLGCDTETYYVNSDVKGLKSIQVSGDMRINEYFTTGNFNQDDLSIRFEICDKFFTFLFTLNTNVDIAFFNLNFDGSQFIYWLVTQSGYQIDNSGYSTKKGTMRIFETDMKLYSIEIRTHSGFLIKMLDLANFIVGSNLNNACKDWLNDEKVELESKRFDKRPATEIERQYAIKDANLTYRLYLQLIDHEVISGHRNLTIASRTLSRFRDFTNKEYGIKFNEFFYPNMSNEEIELTKSQFEIEIRKGVRGGICQAWHRGIYDHCTHIDARSMYPTQCVKDLIPVGGLLNSKPCGAYTKIVYPSGFFTLRDGRVPCVQWHNRQYCQQYAYLNRYDPSDYVHDFYLDGSYPIWIDEYNLIKQNYYVDDETIDKEWYIEMANNTMLKDYVERDYRGKRENTGTKRNVYKYFLNALYGKFLSRPDGISIEYVKEKNKWNRIKVDNIKATYYLPLGSWIAMQGRITLMNAINSIDSEDFLYCDTDSIIYKGDKMPDIKIGKNLGEWGIEQSDVKVNVVGAKTYQELTSDGTLITKCGGLPSREKNLLEWGELQDGMKIDTFKPRRDKDIWAINIEPVTYTVNTKVGMFT